MQVFLATQNPEKVKEYQSLLKNYSLKLLKPPKLLIFKESGLTFRANAVIKASVYGHYLKAPVLADDSGLAIAALKGFPGVKTSRFARDDYPRAMKTIINKLKNSANRRAKYVCALALFRPGKKVVTFVGEVGGLITFRPRGNHGFGFDPIFYYPPAKKTFAEIPLSQKNLYSHRSRALKKFINSIKSE